ncbi:kinase-like protein, partial [Bimuria novae-zelandiae CBS 107.79]
DLIAFLALVHRPSLDIVFAKWDAYQTSLGHGATGQVDQSSLNLRANLAFKRAKEIRRSRNISDEFRVLISEVLTLTQPSTRYHPQIITLEAVSWEFHPETGYAWPVLLFEKAHHGDLLSFLQPSKGQVLSFKERLRLCKDVALALISLHRFAIIHGDVTPKNILVFEDHGVYHAKLADFGYAAAMVRGEPIDLARTWPWNAPEIGYTWSFEFDEARRTDIYSFGVVCLWACFSPSMNRETCLSQ